LGKVIIPGGVIGVMYTPTASDHLPISPEDIAAQTTSNAETVLRSPCWISEIDTLAVASLH
jgi:hypothetical protein